MKWSWLFLLFAGAPFFAAAQECSCSKGMTCIYKTPQLAICGTVLDSSGSEKIISKFTVSSADSMLIDERNNQGASFLLASSRSLLVITEIKLEIKEDKYKYPEKYARRVVQVVKGKPVLFQSEVRAMPIVAHLRNDFKKIRELY